MPPLGCSKSKAVAYKRCLVNEMETINAHRLITTENCVTKPRRWKGKKHTKKQKKKYKRHKKRVKAFNEMDKALLTYIRSTAFCTGHQLSNQLAEMTSGVEAFDFIMQELDPIRRDEIASSSNALKEFNDYKLTSISKGSFSKFAVNLMDKVEELRLNKISLATDDNSLKLSLFNKLPPEYSQVFVQEDVFKNLSFKDALAKLQRFAVHIEKESTGGRVHTTSATEQGSKDMPDEILGYKLDHNGNIPHAQFEKMTKGEKDKYFDAKRKLREEGVVLPKFESDAEKKLKELESKIKELEATTNGEPVPDENGESKPKARKTGKADVMNMSYKEVLEQIPDEKQRKKLVNYVNAKLDASKH